jgi:uncharacterized protein
MPSLSQYIYSRSSDGLWVNLFIASEATTPLGAQAEAGKVTLQQATNYPWDGSVKFTVTPDAPREFTLRVRMPGWATKPMIRVNGATATPEVTRGYAAITRQWKSGDTVEVSLPMEVQRLAAHPKVLHAQGKIALRRGPMIDSLEQADNTVSLRDIVLPANATFQSRFDPSLAGGVVKLTTEGLVHDAANWDRQLYQPVPASTPKASKRVTLTAVPYAIWGNRGLGEMIVWIDASSQ